MKTLHLNLKKQWFDMILSGEKKEEYRDIKPFYIQRFLDSYFGYKVEYDISGLSYLLREIGDSKERFDKNVLYRYYDTITFSNGYSKNRRQFEIELKSIKVDEGKQEWGAEPSVKYFVLKLGEIINKINC